MSERKSGRARKVVDYTKFGDDLDDDFADSTPPASKKPRLSNKENKNKKSNQNVKHEEKVKLKSSSRKSVEERRYERELQEALELSMSQSDPSQETTSASPNDDKDLSVAPPLSHDASQNEAPSIAIQDNETDAPSPILPVLDDPPVLPKMTKVDDEIEVLESDIEVVPSSRRGASKKKKYIDSDSESGGEDFEVDLRKFLSSPLTPKVRKRTNNSDSDFAPEDDDDSLDDDDDGEDDYDPEDSDSDFGSSKKKKSTKKPAPKVTKATTQNKKGSTGSAKTSAPKAAKVLKSTGNSKPGITHKPLVTSSSTGNRTPSSSLTANKPSHWKPPGMACKSPSVLNTKTNNNVIGKSPVSINSKNRPPISSGIGKSPLGGVNIKSPSSGLRIGLSRNMKLKPLHPNLKMQN